jgi:hypothetical protein
MFWLSSFSCSSCISAFLFSVASVQSLKFVLFVQFIGHNLILFFTYWICWISIFFLVLFACSKVSFRQSTEPFRSILSILYSLEVDCFAILEPKGINRFCTCCNLIWFSLIFLWFSLIVWI